MLDSKMLDSNTSIPRYNSLKSGRTTAKIFDNELPTNEDTAFKTKGRPCSQGNFENLPAGRETSAERSYTGRHDAGEAHGR